ncbi:transglycosylase SLT domain-containing protein [Leptolyngbya sp. O-77]|uniref:transglycosylase SLT domain-containing protein n=1 Tax=Leptolyngbya sp. O-77 TaxID=1080068 RepID=UPI000837CCC8|nr:transglycosylase SLT domain-containing protein [Leptolyngbya sp. O-77]
MKRKRTANVLWLSIGTGLTVLLLGAAATRLWPQASSNSAQNPTGEETLAIPETPQSAVFSLATQPPQQRAAQLQLLAQGKRSDDQKRARFLLASDLIQQGQAAAAVPFLERLDKDYSTLAAYALKRQAQAHAAAGETDQATEAWRALADRFAKKPASVEALYELGKADPQYWQRAIARFPAHPRSLEIAQTLLKQDPKQPELLLQIARYGHYLPQVGEYLDRLTKDYADTLEPEDWEAIAFLNWEKQRYGEAGKAYAKAPRTPLNAYREGRGAQLAGRRDTAITAYNKVVAEFPDSPEAPTSLLRLAQLGRDRAAKLTHLDRVISQYPDRAGDALLEKYKLVKPDAAQATLTAQVAQMLLENHSKTDAAAELRWMLAEEKAAQGDIQGAWTLARQVAQENPDSPLAAEAAFWVGKWAQRLGQTQEASQAYEYVLSRYPESYYAWRSATMLGWDVGDFTTVRQKLPSVKLPATHPMPLAGSDTLKELYQLGQFQDAWALWQTEFTNRKTPTVEEQFTDGLIRLGVGDNLEGIFQISSLVRRTEPEVQPQVQALRRQGDYWRSLFPFQFAEPIQQWSQTMQLNPLLVTALIRQESRFERQIVSSAGATGLMQLMPGTASWVASKLNQPQYDLENPNDNIKLGTWYLNYTHETYSNNALFAVASYNAGPGAIAEWIERFGYSDPDVFVEQIPYPETKGYVEAVFSNYWNYLRLYNPDVSAKLAQLSTSHRAVAESLP